MRAKKQLISIAILTSLSLGLAGCGSSSSSDAATNSAQDDIVIISENTYTGVFIDSAVEGLNYKTATQSGTTNSAGEFQYQIGESVIFSIGGIEFPATDAMSQVTPLNVFNTTDVEETSVTNMLRLLQTLDEDGLPENGITILDDAHDLLTATSLTFTDEHFESIIDDALISYTGVNTSLISVEAAVNHFTQSILMDDTSSSCTSDHPLVGAQADFQTYSHGVMGTATIIDDCTITVENFVYDAAAPAVYFYSDTSADFFSDAAFILGDQLRDNGVEYNNETITLTLPANKTLDDIEYLSVWCVDFDVNFGDLQFEQPFALQRFTL